jgi:DNA-binding SARP family transcriptional activator/predicted ATPase
VTPIRIELLGKLRITFGQHPIISVNTNRMRSLLAFLVLHGESAQSREHLASLLWPESGDAQARTNLRQLLHHLRRALPVECSLLVSDNQTVRWLPDRSCSVDVFEFEAAVQAAEVASKGEFTAAREALERATRLYQDDLLPDLYDDWLQSKREQLRQQLAEVLSRLSALYERVGDYPAGIRQAVRLVALDPLREAYYQTLMRLHIGNHDRSSALRVYHQCMRNLQRELGVSPTKATQDLFLQALKSSHSPSTPVELPSDAVTRPLPLVGRKIELERLLGCWRRVSDGEPHFALLMGEPGLGKSRLAEELFESCSRKANQAAARSRCYAAQGQLAYGPVAEWLRSEPIRLARAQLPKPQLAELARVLPEILIENPEIAAPHPLTDSWQRLHLYEALNATFRRAPKPLLLLIDDLHWCDYDSFEWLHSFFRSGAAARVLVLGTARVEETGRDHPLGKLLLELRQSAHLSEFSIPPLSIDETAALADQIATRECDPEFLHRLFQTTKGNPLFVVESVRASLEDQISKNAVPPRVQSVIASRLAQLSPPAYELVGLAAAIGRPFSLELLAKATDWDEDSLSRALEELWQRRIIDGQGGGTYDFTHGLLREVAYSELNPIRMRSLHRRIARGLEELNAPDLDAVSGWLAAHYEAAGMAEQAIRCFKVAASVAKQRFSDAEAADLIRRALRLCRDFPETAKRDWEELELLVNLGPSLVTTEGYSMPEVGETYERGLLLSRRSGDQRHLFPLQSGAWVFRIVRGQLEESRRLAQESVDDARREGALPQQMAGHFLLGTSLFHLGQLDASWEQIEKAVPASDTPSHPALALFAGPDVSVFRRAYLSHLLCLFGQEDEAVAKSNESIDRAREISHPFTLGIALDYAAMLNVYRGDCDLALARAVEAAEVCRKHGFAYYLALADIFIGWATGMNGDSNAGLAKLRAGLDALKTLRAELRLPFYHGLLAEVYGAAGQTGEALANVATGFAFLNKNGEAWSAPELNRIHGDLLLRSGDASQSRVSYQRAIALARQTGARLFELRAAARLRALPAHENDQANAAER